MKVIRLYPKKEPRWLRISLRVLLVILLLLVALLLALQSRWGQEFLTRKVQSTLQNTLRTRVDLHRIRLNGFNQVAVEGLTIFDRQQQVLLHSDSVSVHFSLLPLFWKEVKIHSLHWKNLLGNVYTQENDSLNYQFILTELAGTPDAATPADTASSGSWKISLGRIELEKIRLRYNDQPGGINTALVLQHLSWRFRETAINEGRYDFNELRINGLKGYFHQVYRPAQKTSSSAQPVSENPLQLLVNGKLLELEDIQFSYADEGSGIHTGWLVSNARLKLISADIGQNRYQAATLAFTNPRGFLLQNTGKDTTQAVAATNTPPLLVKLQSLGIKNGAFGMQQRAAERTRFKQAIDFNYLGISGLQADLTSINWEQNQLKANLKELRLKERSGFEIKKALGEIRYGNDSASLKNYYLQTGASYLSNNLVLYLPADRLSGALITSRIGLQADLPNSKLVLSEALYFAPELKDNPNFKKWWNKEIRVSGKLNGNLSSLLLNQFQVKDNAGNTIAINGRLKNLTDTENISGDLKTLTIQTGKAGISAWLPENTLPPNIQLAEKIDLRGSISGGLNGFTTRLQLNSSYGKMQVSGAARSIRNKARASYALVLDELDMDAGKWISDSTIGRIRASGQLKGRGFDPATMYTTGNIKLREATIKGYNYQQIEIAGSLQNNQYTALLNSLDSNLKAGVELKGELREGYPSVAGKLQVHRIDLQAIGLSTEPMVVKGLAELDLSDTRPRELNGTVNVLQVQYANETDHYQLDSIQLTAEAEPGAQSIQLKSPFGTAVLLGNYDYTKLAKTVSLLIDKQLNPADSGLLATADSIGSQTAILTASFVLPRSLEKILPDMDLRKPLLLEGRINTDSSLIYLLARQPQFRYGDAIIDSLEIMAYLNADSVHASVEFAGIEHPSLPVHHSSFTAKGEKGAINWLLAIDDAAKKPSYRIGGAMALKSVQNFTIGLSPELLLNKEKFYAKADTAVLFRDGKLVDAAFEIGSDNQSIRVDHQQPDSSATAAYLLTIKDFQARTISSFVSKDTSLAEGLINAKLRFSQAADDSSITGDLQIDSLHMFGKPVGTIQAALVKSGQEIGIDGSLSGYGNKVLMKGSYGKSLRANLEFDSLQLASMEPFTGGAVTNMSGAVTGTLAVSGELSNPSLQGELLFNKGKMRVSYLNNPLLIDQQKLLFEADQLTLRQFTLKDTAGGNAVLEGTIGLKDLQNPVFDLGVNADNFMVLGPKVSEDQLMWGPAKINSTIKV
ncbi:hypothetical protein, partial [Flavihumibacter sp. CACIAM 22H1]|uniref:DUF748 domain-containing protein n=1 Tax=Flavihumibacter sp. CACIAM 22H1 TaxID=1812911 RepID=UPI0007A8D10E